MLTLKGLYDRSSDPAYRAAIEIAAQWAGWQAECTRELMESIERLV